MVLDFPNNIGVGRGNHHCGTGNFAGWGIFLFLLGEFDEHLFTMVKTTYYNNKY